MSSDCGPGRPQSIHSVLLPRRRRRQKAAQDRYNEGVGGRADNGRRCRRGGHPSVERPLATRKHFVVRIRGGRACRGGQGPERSDGPSGHAAGGVGRQANGGRSRIHGGVLLGLRLPGRRLGRLPRRLHCTLQESGLAGTRRADRPVRPAHRTPRRNRIQHRRHGIHGNQRGPGRRTDGCVGS